MIQPSDQTSTVRPKAFGLPIKITLPFVALFALLLLALGVVLAREILAQVEARVENEQRFSLFAAIEFGNPERIIGQLNDIKERSTLPEFSSARAEFIVFENDMPIFNTFKPPEAAAIADALKKAKTQSNLAKKDELVHRVVTTLNDKAWLILFRSRPHSDVYLLYPYIEIEQAQNRALTRIVTLGGLGLLAALVLGLLMGKWVARPVVKLASAARQVTTGGLQDPAGVKELSLSESPHATDEIGDLTLAFQTMLATLRRSQEELVKSERLAATGKLAASVAHEIRNPLTSLRMTAQMLQKRAGETDATTREGYTLLLREIDRLALAVEELLTFARPRPPRREPTDLNKLVTDTLKFMEHQLAHARIRAATEFDSKLPENIPIDPNKVRQLLVNLVLNAQQAIVRDGTVTVRTQWDEAAKTVTLSVLDTGPGVADEVRNKIFDLFVSTKDGGGGIGLAVAKQIAEEHGGSIGFESTPKGATFIAKLKAES